MNALHPMPVAQGGKPPWPDAAGTLRLVRRLSGCYGAVLLLGALIATPLGAEARSTGLADLALGAVLLAWAGLLATLVMVWVRPRVGQPALPPKPARGRWARLLPRRRVRLAGDERMARMARRPQGMVVPALSLAAACAVWRWPGASRPLRRAVLLGGAVVLGFPLLVMERIVGSVPRARLPEAPALKALLFVPVVTVPLAGLLHMLAWAGMAWARPVNRALRALVRGRDDLVAQRVALANQLRSLLEGFWPGAAAIFAAIDSPIALAFVGRYPTPDSASRLGIKRWARANRYGDFAGFMAQHAYCGRRSPAELLARLRAAPVSLASDAEADAKGELVRALAAVLERLIIEIAKLSSRIEHAIAELPDGRIVMWFPNQVLRGHRRQGPAKGRGFLVGFDPGQACVFDRAGWTIRREGEP